VFALRELITPHPSIGAVCQLYLSPRRFLGHLCVCPGAINIFDFSETILLEFMYYLPDEQRKI
jgi:hypothetical protein